MLSALALLSTRALDVRRLRDLLDPQQVVRSMREAGAEPNDLASQAVAAAMLAPEIDDLIRPGALPDLPGMVDDVAGLVVEALDGPAAALALIGIYRRALRRGVSVAPPVAPERPRANLGDVRARVRERAVLRRSPVVVSDPAEPVAEDPTAEALNPAASDAGVVVEPLPGPTNDAQPPPAG